MGSGSSESDSCMNVIEIWAKTGHKLPFAVRRNTWRRHVFVVRRVAVKKFPYGDVFGDLYRDDQIVRKSRGKKLGRSGCHEWICVSMPPFVTDDKISLKGGGGCVCSKCGKPFLLRCVFQDNVLCSYRTNEEFGIMDRCFSCPHYERFNREMEEDDERMMNEIDREREELEHEE
jgi:hypothetical protein